MTQSTSPSNSVEFKGSRTEKNVMNAYFNETEAYARYTFYAKAADKENYFPVGQIFRQTADNELHHAKVFFKMLQGGTIDLVLPGVLCGTIGDTKSNLQQAISEEHNEGMVAYEEFAAIAEEEGFTEIAEHFRAISSIEREHHNRFQRYLKMIEDGTMWKREKPIKWRCLVCGYTFEGTEPPQTCPGCDHPREHYMAYDDIDNL